MQTQHVGLIVEGGGMRGAYTGGVLEAFSSHNLYFPYQIGVSAGANTLCSYLSHQKGRNKRLYTEWITDKRFIHWTNLFKEGAYFGMNFLFDELPITLDPFDFETFKQNDVIFKVGVTDCETGEAVFLEPLKAPTPHEANKMLRASSSLPIIAKPVEINGHHYLDGGLSDSIPIRESIRDGNTKHILVLTRNAGYRKTPSKIVYRASKHALKQYPAITECIANRYKVYNETLDQIETLQKENRAFIIQPQKPLDVDRFEKNVDKLKALYEQGYNEAEKRLDALKAWL